jgi:Glyoxalase-like domain
MGVRVVARLRDIVVDCAHPASLARFWAAVLDGYAVAPYDQAELERLRANGIDDPEDDPSVLVTAGEDQPRFFFTRVPEAKTVKNRVHLDLRAGDHATELARLTALGARVIADLDAWTVLEDPEGNEFCLLR